MQAFAQRRHQVMQVIGKDSVFILPAAPEQIRNADSDHLYRQNSDFYYLTGFKEPEAVMILAPGRAEGEFILFNRERNLAQEIWVGARAGQEGAVNEFKADQAFPITSMNEKLPELLKNYRRIYYPAGKTDQFDQQVMHWVNQLRIRVRAGVQAPLEFISSDEILHAMRLIKSSAEIELMRYVARVSATAHRQAMQACKPGMMEYELQAVLLAEFSRHGCYPPAYNCIVGGGANACVLHYVDNNARLHDGNLVLIDAGGEYNYYASDITRTFPVNGKFSPEQRAIYALVLKAQKAVIAIAKPGIEWPKLQEAAIQVITEGLLELGLLQGKLEDLLVKKAYLAFYMHNIGHWLGLDTHDVGGYRINGEWRKLEPGIIFTIEPGIYIRPDSSVDKKWWNIGVRIEDDVLVTAESCEILTSDVPKEIAEIEALMAKK